MNNTEAARAIVELLKKPLYVVDKYGDLQEISNHDKLALGKAISALRKIQSCKGDR